MNHPLRFLRTQGSHIAIASLTGLFSFLTTAAQAQVLYGMSDVKQLSGPDEIVRIDVSTGVATRLHIFGSGLDLLESLCFDERENALWTTNDGVLLRINPQTFSTVTIGDTGVDDIDGLAIQPGTFALYGITYGGNDVVRIDKSDAGTTILNGSLEEGSRLEDLAFDSSGRLYVLTSRALVEVNPATGAKISRVLLSGATSLEGLVWDAPHATFLSAADRGSSKDLVTINRSTGQVLFVSPTLHSGFKDIEALAFVPGTPVVPVALRALDVERSDRGVRLVWEGDRSDVTYVIERAQDAAGPWTDVAHVDLPARGRARAWQFEYQDGDAAKGELAANTLYYRVGAADDEGAWSYAQFTVEAVPTAPVVLHPNAPNPFNPTTAFEVRVTAASRVDLTLFDVHGRTVRTLRADLGAGTHQLVWDGRDGSGRSVAAGVYPYVLRGGSQVLRGRAVLVK